MKKLLKQLFNRIEIEEICREEALKQEIHELKQDIYFLVGDNEQKRKETYQKWHLHKELNEMLFI